MKLKQRIYRLLSNLRQRSYRLFCVIIACLAAVFGLSPSVNGAILRVDSTILSCPGDGISWGTAYKYLQDALEFASDPDNNIDEIWVKAGAYFVDQDCLNEDGTGLRTATFDLVEGVKLYGGFDGTETLLIQRDPLNNITILSGVLVPPDPSDPPMACTDPDPEADDGHAGPSQPDSP